MEKGSYIWYYLVVHIHLKKKKNNNPVMNGKRGVGGIARWFIIGLRGR